MTALGGPAAHALCQRLGAAATELRSGDFPGGRHAFAEQVSHLTDTELEDVARAYALWCHLMNIAAAELGVDGVRELCGRSRFFRGLVRNCEMSLVRSDIDVAREYAFLADPEAARLFTLIEAEHARTVAALTVTLGITTPLAARPYLASSVARRNHALDVLSHAQIEALRRRRAGAPDPERLGRIVFTAIGGIAAGLQTAG